MAILDNNPPQTHHDNVIDLGTSPKIQPKESKSRLNFRYSKTESVKKHILIIGVGGAGGNAVNFIYEKKIPGVSLLLCNTDKQDLGKSPIDTSNKILIGRKGLDGKGAGNKPEVAECAAKESQDEIRAFIQKAKDEGVEMVFITAGLGGGTGTGASTVIADIVRAELGLLTVALVSLPNRFAGGNQKALVAIRKARELKNKVDSIMVLNNEFIFQEFPDLTQTEALEKADQNLANAAMTISNIIYRSGKINVDLNDVRTTLENGGYALILTGEGRGENKLTEAFNNALNCPLLTHRDLFSCRKLLYAVTVKDNTKENDVKTGELNQLYDLLGGLNAERNSIDGVLLDPDMKEGELRISIVASGIPEASIMEQKERETSSEDPIERQNRKISERKDQKLMDTFYPSTKNKGSKEAELFIFNLNELDNDSFIDMIDEPLLDRQTDALIELRSKLRNDQQNQDSSTHQEENIQHSNKETGEDNNTIYF